MFKGKVKKYNSACGSSIAEGLAGLVLLIPLSLLFIDLAALVLAQTANDALAKEAARTAAQTSQTPTETLAQAQTQAQDAVNTVISNFHASKLMTVTSSTTNYTADTVTVKTSITCTLPVPLPFIGTTYQTFTAEATEPVVGNLPSGSSTASSGPS